MRKIWLGVTLLTLLSGGCPTTSDGGSAGKQIALRVYGEAFIEEQIPASETDGWTITFDRFLICIGAVEIERGGTTLATTDGYRVFDLAASSGGSGFALAMLDVDATDGLHRLRYRVAPAADATAGNATADDVALLQDNGYSIYVELTATDGSETRQVTLGFTTATRYSGCFTTIDFDEQGAASVELTIHGDHLFYAELRDHAAVRFAEIAAADGDADGTITRDELATAATVSRASDLAALMDALVQTVGHIDGEGHCLVATPE